MIPDQEKDLNGALMQLFWAAAHILHHISGGRGGQKRILSVLLRNGPISQAELTEYLGIQSASASEVLGKMESAGLICREANETDRRTILLTLTPLGREQAAAAAVKREQHKNELFSVLSPEEKATLLSILEKLTAHWRQRYGEPGKRGRRPE